jgi:hypothetical protein
MSPRTGCGFGTLTETISATLAIYDSPFYLAKWFLATESTDFGEHAVSFQSRLRRNADSKVASSARTTLSWIRLTGVGEDSFRRLPTGPHTPKIWNLRDGEGKVRIRSAQSDGVFGLVAICPAEAASFR